MTVTALLELRLEPESLDEALKVVSEVLVATRAFDGNLGVEVVADENDPAHVVAVEKWESLAHDDAYRAWRATPAGASALGQYVTAAPVLTRWVGTDA